MPSKDEVARHLASQHYLYDPDLVGIIRIVCPPERESNPEEPIKLLEVNPYTPPGGIVPTGFDPHPPSGVPYATVLVEVTPDEYERVKSGELPLPPPWSLGEELPRLNGVPAPVGEAG